MSFGGQNQYDPANQPGPYPGVGMPYPGPAMPMAAGYPQPQFMGTPYPEQPMNPYGGTPGFEMGAPVGVAIQMSMPIAQPMMMQGSTQVIAVQQGQMMGDDPRNHHSSKQKKIEKLRKKYENKGLFHYNKPCFFGMICGCFCGILKKLCIMILFCFLVKRTLCFTLLPLHVSIRLPEILFQTKGIHLIAFGLGPNSIF
jgi:hypothetical protein